MADKSRVMQTMKICRFCFCDRETELLDIYEKNKQASGRSVPLALQIMSCMAIEVFPNDGLPQFICTNCRRQTQQCYVFKANCKKAHEALKQFLLNSDTELEKPCFRSVKKPIKTSPREFKVVSKTSDISGISTETKKLADGTEVITLSVESSQIETEEIADHSPEKVQPEEEAMDIGNAIEYEIINDEQEEPVLQLSSSKSATEETEEKIPAAVFPCRVCDRSFPLEKLLNIHLNLKHKIKKPYPCDLCNKKFVTKIELKKHQIVHSGNDNSVKYKCQLCEKTFIREHMLRRHQLVHNNDYCIRCVLCGKTFPDNTSLEHHMESHERTDTLSCPECNKSFVFRQGLERHMSTHEEKTFTCNYCEATFNSAFKVAKHMTGHSGLRPYHCKVCKHNFTLNHHLTRHMKCHAVIECGNSPEDAIMKYKCDLCSMAFKQQQTLLEHSIIHSMVNVTCVICNTSFETADEVQDHIKTHLEGLQFPCDKCDYSFDQAKQLEIHLLKHAQMEYEEKIEEELVAEAKKEKVYSLSGSMNTPERRSSTTELQQFQLEEEEHEEEEEKNEVVYTIDMENQEVFRASSQPNPLERLIVEQLQPEFQPRNLSTEFNMEEPQDEPMEEDCNESLERNETEAAEYNSQHLFKCEIDSDEEQETNPFDNQENDEEEKQAVKETLKPIVRNEGTKMYARKGPIERKLPEQAPLETVNLASPEEINESSLPMLDLTQENIPVKPLQTNLEKIGDKVVRVQKFIMTKEEIKKLQKQGLIEVRGGRVVLKNRNNSILDASIKPIERGDIDNLIKSSPKPQLRSYQRRITENEASILERAESFRSQL